MKDRKILDCAVVVAALACGFAGTAPQAHGDVMAGPIPDASYANLYRWYAPGSIHNVGDGTNISVWTNKAGSVIAAGDLDEVPGHANANAPVLSVGLANGHNALTFDDSDGNRIWDSGGTINWPTTVFFVSRIHNHAQTAEDLFDGTVSSARHAQRVDGLFYSGSVSIFGDDMRDNQWHVQAWTFNGASSTWYKDGLLHASGNTGPHSNWTGFMLGSAHDSEPSGNTENKDLDGDVGEILVYDEGLSLADRQAVEDYLHAKYGIRSFRNPLTEATGEVVWTMVVIPDTQNYVRNASTEGIFDIMTQWIVTNKVSRNIGLVLHEGDIVNRNNSTADNQTSAQQWQHAENAMFVLKGEVPYILTTGNHDHGFSNAENRDTQFHTYFHTHDNPLVDPNQGGIMKGSMVSGELLNAYYELIAPDGRKLLIIALEWGPRQSTVDWALGIASLPQYADHTAALLTHAHIHFDESRYDHTQDVDGNGSLDREWNPHSYGTAPDTNDGQELWDKLLKHNGNFEMTFNGHVLGDGRGYLVSHGDEGNPVHQMLFNTQFESNGGNGWLRLLEYMWDGRTVQVRTYSPYLDQWLTDPDNQFTFELSMAPSPPDSDGDGMPDFWEDKYHGGPTNGVPGADLDLDEFDNLSEWIADTNPTNSNSKLVIDSITTTPTVEVGLEASSNRVYTLWKTGDLAPPTAWTNVLESTKIQGNGPGTVLKDSDIGGMDSAAYRVEVELD